MLTSRHMSRMTMRKLTSEAKRVRHIWGKRAHTEDVKQDIPIWFCGPEALVDD